MSKPRHQWEHVSGSAANIPSDLIQRCKHCNVYRREGFAQSLTLGAASGRFTSTATWFYSKNGKRWSDAKPVCVRRPT